MIRGRSPEEIRTFFNIQNDMTFREGEQVRKYILILPTKDPKCMIRVVGIDVTIVTIIH